MYAPCLGYPLLTPAALPLHGLHKAVGRVLLLLLLRDRRRALWVALHIVAAELAAECLMLCTLDPAKRTGVFSALVRPPVIALFILFIYHIALNRCYGLSAMLGDLLELLFSFLILVFFVHVGSIGFMLSFG